MPDPVVTAAPNALAWRLGRNCRLRPAHLLLGVCAAPAAACVPAAVLLALGYPFVALFALLDALFVGAAVIAYGMHAADTEYIEIAGGQLLLAVHDGLHRSVHRWNIHSVRVAAGADGSIELMAPGGTYRLGRHVAAAQCRSMFVELARSLETARSATAPAGR